MDKKPATEKRVHFKYIVPSAYPILVHPEVVRDAIVMLNEGTQAMRIGHSGTVSTNGMYLDGGKSLADNYSSDAWWAQATSASGTISGFVVT